MKEKTRRIAGLVVLIAIGLFAGTILLDSYLGTETIRSADYLEPREMEHASTLIGYYLEKEGEDVVERTWKDILKKHLGVGARRLDKDWQWKFDLHGSASAEDPLFVISGKTCVLRAFRDGRSEIVFMSSSTVVSEKVRMRRWKAADSAGAQPPADAPADATEESPSGEGDLHE
jgi:hypothetical protein